MKSHRKELWFEIPLCRALANITLCYVPGEGAWFTTMERGHYGVHADSDAALAEAVAERLLPLASSTIENPLNALLIWGRVQWNAGKISKPASLATGSARVAIGINVGRSGRIMRVPSGDRLGAPRGTLGAVKMSAITWGGVR